MKTSPHRFALLCLFCGLLAAGVAFAEPPKPLNLAQYRGKIIVVDFWASWCAPCRQSFPWLNEMQAKYGARGLIVIGVNVDREQSDAERFLQQVPAQFQIVYDPNGELAQAYEVPGMPTSFVFDADGRLNAKHVGFRNASRAVREAQLQALLATSARGDLK